MRKTLGLLASVILLLFLVTACGGDGGEASSTASPSGSSAAPAASGAPQGGETGREPVTIQFWHIFTDGPAKDLYNQLIDDFQKQYDWITVEQLAANFFDYGAKISTALAGGSGPDIALAGTGDQTFHDRARANAILQLDPFIQRDNWDMNQYFPVLTERVKFNGAYYQMPLETDVRVLYYNKKMFREAGLDPDKPPTNWAELEQYAEKLTKWNDKNMLEQIGFAPALGNLGFWTLAWTNGAEFFDAEGNPTIDTPEALEALEFWIRMQNKYGDKAFSAFQTQAGSLGYSPFIGEKVAMIVDVNYLMEEIEVYNPDLEYGIAPIPYQKKPASWSAGWSLELVDNKDPRKADAAWELMKYLTGKDVQMRIRQTFNSLVANQEAAMAPEFMNDPNWKIVVEQMQHSRFLPLPEEALSWASFLNKNLEAAMHGGMTPKQALEKTQRETEQEIANYRKTHGGK